MTISSRICLPSCYLFSICREWLIFTALVGHALSAGSTAVNGIPLDSNPPPPHISQLSSAASRCSLDIFITSSRTKRKTRLFRQSARGCWLDCWDTLYCWESFELSFSISLWMPGTPPSGRDTLPCSKAPQGQIHWPERWPFRGIREQWSIASLQSRPTPVVYAVILILSSEGVRRRKWWQAMAVPVWGLVCQWRVDTIACEAVRLWAARYSTYWWQLRSFR